MHQQIAATTVTPKLMNAGIQASSPDNPITARSAHTGLTSGGWTGGMSPVSDEPA
jgi:hypothetical protein